MSTVTAVLPEISEERLSSRERQRGKKARRGWMRALSGTDASAKGGYALLADGDTFLRPGEALLKVGAVVALVDYEGDVQLAKVTPSGRLLKVRHPDGKWRYWNLQREIVSLCAEVDRLLALDPVAHLREVAALIEALPPEKERSEAQVADLAEARGLLAALAVVAEGPSVEELRAERARLAARIAEIDSLLAPS